MELGKIIVFIHRKLTGDLNERERQLLAEQLEREEHADLEQDIDRIWAAGNFYKKSYRPDVDKSWDAFSTRLAAEKAGTPPPLRAVFRRRLAFAATFLLLVLAGVAWWNSREARGATETFATAGAETLTVTLPDASRIVLNEHSRLSYVQRTEGEAVRDVALVGEAYFDITPNADRPFSIHTEKADIQVLGTAFNLRAYPDEDFTEVAVTEGRVRLSRRHTDEGAVVLLPGEVGVLYHADNALYKSDHSALNAQSWRTRELSFRNTPLIEVIEALERHFHIDIRLDNLAVSRCTFNSNFSEINLEQIMDVLKVGLRLDIRQTGEKTYLLSGGDCTPIH